MRVRFFFEIKFKRLLTPFALSVLYIGKSLYTSTQKSSVVLITVDSGMARTSALADRTDIFHNQRLYQMGKRLRG
jgi:hypothetical protein